MTYDAGGVPPRLELRGITKRFPGVVANDGVSFPVRPGEIHALLGENGAGKSTLVKIIYGVLHADEGEVLWNGQAVQLANPHAARRLGIGMVFQHFSLFDGMTVLENIALGLEGKPDMRSLSGRIVEVSQAYGLPLDPRREIHTLSVGERQRVEIVRCLLQDPKLLIMDEPTSVLTPQEVERLFGTLRLLASEGCSILYISHKLQEIKDLCDHATILRGGKVVGECDPAVESTRGMAQMMIGAELKTLARRGTRPKAATRFTVEALDLPTDQPFGTTLKRVGFEVAAGEIFGIAGVAGNGQNELMRALSGELTVANPTSIRLDGKPVGDLGVERRRALGLCCVPEERNGHAAVPDMSLASNTLISARNRMKLVLRGWIRRDATRDFAERIIQEFGVKARGPDSAARSLSGGNLQKYIVGREILQAPEVLVIAQPTWGVDAGAAAAIHQALFNLAQNGASIVVVSQDLDELLTLCDRLAVLNVGTLSKAIDTADASLEEIGLLMGGLHGMSAEVPATHGAENKGGSQHVA
ncbi:ABC transporter ATP-binding protein [Skermanella mucosa]|uniref:ABC transporter ATP-binding protein n=1 Tax=Skermanella mucosa TaxID=1789672 RepID=UPI00192CCB56|nr:ABC transporter ATP-binding protein [Skermanella mucosa]UEM23644.1 ABC transporter ATP-binding protein [Skermanella mucosa]